MIYINTDAITNRTLKGVHTNTLAVIPTDNLTSSSQQRGGNFRISTGISKPRHVFVFLISDANIDAQTANPFLYNTFSDSTDPIHRLEIGIINLDNSIGGGTHWVCYRNVDNQFCEYFDSFGLIIPNEMKNYLHTSGKKNVYSSDEIQKRDSVLCGYWCLYYLLERQKRKSLLNVIHNTKFSFTDQMINHQFLTNYFKSM